MRLNPWQAVRKDKKITYVQDELKYASVSEVSTKFNLDWNVDLWDVAAINEESKYFIDNKYATMKIKNDEEPQPLAVVGSYYKPTQNHDFIMLLNQLRTDGIAEFVAGGNINDGRTVYSVMQLNEGINIPDDPHSAYLIARTSHDGSCSLTVSPLLMRIFCTNAINGRILQANKAGLSYTKRHTLNTEISYEGLLIQLQLTQSAVKNWSNVANHLLNLSISDSEFEQMLDNCFKIPESTLLVPSNLWTRSETIIHNKMEMYKDSAKAAWLGADTQANIKNTKYGALQAMFEAIDHSKEMSEAKAKIILLDKESSLKSRAFELVMSGV